MNKIINSIVIFLMLITFQVNSEEDNTKIREFITKLSNEAISIVKDSSMDDSIKMSKLSTLFMDNVDIKWIGKFAMGRHYSELSSKDKEKFDYLFSKFLINSYAPNFKKYTKETIEINNIKMISDNQFLVNTKIIRLNKQPFEVDYMIRKKSEDDLKILDIIAENISLINTKRSEFDSIISSSSAQNLIKMLENKVNEK